MKKKEMFLVILAGFIIVSLQTACERQKTQKLNIDKLKKECIELWTDLEDRPLVWQRDGEVGPRIENEEFFITETIKGIEISVKPLIRRQIDERYFYFPISDYAAIPTTKQKYTAFFVRIKKVTCKDKKISLSCAAMGLAKRVCPYGSLDIKFEGDPPKGKSHWLLKDRIKGYCNPVYWDGLFIFENIGAYEGRVELHIPITVSYMRGDRKKAENLYFNFEFKRIINIPTKLK